MHVNKSNSSVSPLRRPPPSVAALPSKSPSSSPDVTVVLREFEDFDNAVSAAVASVLHILPGVPVVVVADKLPYPPIVLPANAHSVRIVTLDKAPSDDYAADHLEKIITTPFVLFLPDGAMITRRDHVQNLLLGKPSGRSYSIVRPTLCTDDFVPTTIDLTYAANIQRYIQEH